jgi:hypothetical protein
LRKQLSQSCRRPVLGPYETKDSEMDPRQMPRTSEVKTSRGTGLCRASLTCLVVVSAGPAAQAQTLGCATSARSDPARDVLTCPGGLTITAERGTTYRLLDQDGDGRPDGAELRGKGLLVDRPPARRRIRFQVHTPHAIASVRGTIWAIDVTPTRTSVFVARGTVAVQPYASARSFTLGAGDGVDVEPGGAAPNVRRWPEPRAAALLARFGR